MSYLLDTTLLLDFAHGRRTAIELVDRLFAEVEPLYTCDVVTCEALSGGDDIERAAIEGVLAALEYVAIAPGAARWAAENRRLRGAGRRARSLADALIAAAAWSLDATVVTRNPRDFRRQGVRVLAYE